MVEKTNVVNMRPGAAAKGRPRTTEADVASAEARILLNGTIESLEAERSMLEASTRDAAVFHLTLVDKTKVLLRHVCVVGEDGIARRARIALSMVELARIALTAGVEAFEGGDFVSHEITIADALREALGRLETDPDA